MEVTFNPTTVLAILALWVSYTNYRRSNHAVVRVQNCECSFRSSVDENGGQLFAHFRVRLQNLGIPLHDLRMSLNFRGQDGSGRWSIPLRTDGAETLRAGQFAKGMITEFSFRSYQLTAADVALLATLLDARRQAAALTLFAGGFWAWEYRLDGWDVPVKRAWNRLAGWLNGLISWRVGTNREGHPIVWYFTPLPVFLLPYRQADQFVTHLSRGG